MFAIHPTLCQPAGDVPLDRLLRQPRQRVKAWQASSVSRLEWRALWGLRTLHACLLCWLAACVQVDKGYTDDLVIAGGRLKAPLDAGTAARCGGSCERRLQRRELLSKDTMQRGQAQGEGRAV